MVRRVCAHACCISTTLSMGNAYHLCTYCVYSTSASLLIVVELIHVPYRQPAHLSEGAPTIPTNAVCFAALGAPDRSQWWGMQLQYLCFLCAHSTPSSPSPLLPSSLPLLPVLNVHRAGSTGQRAVCTRSSSTEAH